MTGCTHCGSPKPADMRLEIAKSDAKKDAILYKKPMAIYQVDGEYRHGDAFIFNAAAGYAVIDVVSQY